MTPNGFFRVCQDREGPTFACLTCNKVPWVPEDIFFLSILMVGGEVALTRKKNNATSPPTISIDKKKISSGTQGSNKAAFIRAKLNSLLYKTNRFHVAVHLSSNRSQRTSKCGKNISDTLGYCLVCHFFVLTTF